MALFFSAIYHRYEKADLCTLPQVKPALPPLIWDPLILFVQCDEEKLGLRPHVVEASLSALRDRGVGWGIGTELCETNRLRVKR